MSQLHTYVLGLDITIGLGLDITKGLGLDIEIGLGLFYGGLSQRDTYHQICACHVPGNIVV